MTAGRAGSSQDDLRAFGAVEGEPAGSPAASRALAPAHPEYSRAVDPAGVLVRSRDPRAGARHLLLVEAEGGTVRLEDPAARPREAQGAALVQQGRDAPELHRGLGRVDAHGLERDPVVRHGRGEAVAQGVALDWLRRRGLAGPPASGAVAVERATGLARSAALDAPDEVRHLVTHEHHLLQGLAAEAVRQHRRKEEQVVERADDEQPP